MDLIEAINKRRSIRRYEKKEIPKDVLEELLDAARLAPSSMNRQRWKMVVVTDDRTKRKLVPVCGDQDFIGECSAFLVGVSEPDAYYSMVDMTIALDHLSLRAVELGLGTCWIGDFEPEEVKKILGIPTEREVPICMTLGYPVSVPKATRRKKLAEIFRKDSWEDDWQ